MHVPVSITKERFTVMAGQVTENFQSRRGGFTGSDIPVTKQAVNVDAAIGHRYAVAGNTTTAYVGVDECYRTYAGVGNGPL
jgi:hypothetical protein